MRLFLDGGGTSKPFADIICEADRIDTKLYLGFETEQVTVKEKHDIAKKI
jgi:hypothetical protein